MIIHRRSMKRQFLIRQRDEYFQQHGGQLLSDMMKIDRNLEFTLYRQEDIEVATNNFDKNQIIGEGGQGTVYKGFIENIPVAIKRCKGMDESRRMEFGQELLILCRVNHDHVVKLLGCCLLFEVPILVYEFVPNKTLHDLLHGQDRRYYISLATRLRIAAESSQALGHLHSLARPILHGDVKSANILLGDNLIAKVADFGCSIIARMDEEALVAKGTVGYLDPEYLQSCKLTDKSDVYSFGVVLVELLTGKKPRCLVSMFQDAMKEGTVDELIDEEIINEDDLEVIHQVAELTSRCLTMPGDKRPAMSQVAQELRQFTELVRQRPDAVGDLIALREVDRSFTGTTDSTGYTRSRTTGTIDSTGYTRSRTTEYFTLGITS